MNTSEIFKLQDVATSQNISLFPEWFHWCNRSIQVMLDSHVFLANDADVVAYREKLSVDDISAYEAMNVVVNLAYDALGSIISAIRLAQFGVLADSWSLIRGAFESCCYAEFFSHNPDRIKAYLRMAERLQANRSSDVRQEISKGGLQIAKVLKFLEKRDGENREDFYGRLSNFGTHASPVRSGLRIRINEPEVRVYMSIGHRELVQCLADLAGTAKYAMGIPFEAFSQLMARNGTLVSRHVELVDEYSTTFMS